MIIIASYSNVSVTYTADGTQTVFSFPFDYLRKAFVYVEINGETTLEQGTDFTVYEKTIVFTAAPAADTVVKIYRQTDTTPLVSWADASVLRAKDMTIQQIQVLHILEENQEWIHENTINKTDEKWDAGNSVIGNVGNPENPDDAATKEYIDETYEYVKGKIDDLDSAVETATEAKDIAEDAADRAEAALDEIKEKASWYDNVASMRAAEGLQIGMVAGTKGYYTPNDGGNAFYIIREKDSSTDVDDGGSLIFLDNGNVAELVKEEYVSVKQFGAKGDGVNNDTTAFANALNFAQNKIFTVPNGTYNIVSPLFADGVNAVNDSGSYNNIKPCYPATDFLLDSIKQFSKASDINIDNDKNVEGICYNSDSDKLIIGIKNSDDSVQKLLVVDPSNYQVTETFSYTELGHVNSLTYNSKTKKIYSVVDTRHIAIVDATTMSYENTVTLSESVFCLKYDKYADIFVGYFQDTDSETLYIRHFDSSLNFLREYSANPQNFGTMNGMLIHDGIVLIGSYNYYVQCDYFAKNIKIIESLSSYEVEDFCYCDSDGKIYATYIPSYATGICTLAYFAKNVTNSSGFFGEAGKFIENYDLNNIIEPGVYDVDYGSGSSSALHFPDNQGRGFLGVMRVHDSPNIGSGIQFYSTFTSGGSITIYGRNRLASPNVGGTWHSWKRLDVRGRNHGNSVTPVTFTAGSSSYSYTATKDGIFKFRCRCSGLLQVYTNGTNTIETILQGDGMKAIHMNVKNGDTIKITANGGASEITSSFLAFEYEI